MEHPEFKKFKVDWNMFKSKTRLPTDQVALHLYNSCEQSVKNININSNVDFFKMERKQC